MTTVIDPKLTPRQNFINMVNRDSKYEFKGDEFIISPAAEISPNASWSHGKNTMVTLEAVPGKGFAGEKTLFYNRLHVRQQVEHTRGASPIIIYHFYDLELIKICICRAHSIIPEEMEISGKPPSAGDRAVTLLLKAKAESWLYNGEVSITIDLVPSQAVPREAIRELVAA